VTLGFQRFDMARIIATGVDSWVSGFENK